MNSSSANKLSYSNAPFESVSNQYEYTLMIVDDSDIELRIYSECLSGLCHIVMHNSADEALRAIESGTLPDLILLDANMPGKNGYQMCVELKKRSVTANIIIIIFTSNNDLENKLKGFQSGCSDYLSKPMENSELYHRIEVYLKHIQERRDVEKMAFIDPITGAVNRRTYEYMLQKEWNRCVRYSSSVSLLVIDINDLRLINDTYGNAFGDECLRSVATILGKFGLRSNDLFARFGGQEFVLMLPGCNSKGSSQIAQSMIDRVKKLDMYNPTESRQNFAGLTISIGIAMDYPQSNNLPEELFERAYDAKFLAKQLGENRFITSEYTTKVDEYTKLAVSPYAFSGSRARGQCNKRAGDR